VLYINAGAANRARAQCTVHTPAGALASAASAWFIQTGSGLR